MNLIPKTRFLLTHISILVFVDFFEKSASQVSVRSPESLVRSLIKAKAFDSSDYQILVGASATFGIPYNGASFHGELVYVEDSQSNHCNPSYCSALLERREDERSSTSEAMNNFIFLLDRGNCDFVTKVIIAEECGASGVIIADSIVSGAKREDMKTLTLADNGNGHKIKIPSLMLSYMDTKIFKEELAKNHVFIELKWTLPFRFPVMVTYFPDLGSTDAKLFFSKFANYALLFKDHLIFQPYYNVFYFPWNDKSLCITTSDIIGENNEADVADTFCSVTPESDTNYPAGLPPSENIHAIPGREIVLETVRQLCLLTLHEKVKTPLKGKFSEVYWRYHTLYWDEYTGCSHSSTQVSKEGISACSMSIIHKLLNDSDLRLFQTCISSKQAIDLLVTARSNRTWLPNVIQINGTRLHGEATAKALAVAICTASTDAKTEYRAPECTNILSRIREEDKTLIPEISIISSSVINIVVFMFIIAGLGLYLYSIRTKASTEAYFRDEIRSQVAATLEEYKSLGETLTKEENARYTP